MCIRDSPGTDNPRRRSLVYQSVLGKIGCMADRIVYARSSDGTVVALSRDGAELWRVQIPSFVALVHEDVGKAGIYNGPPAGATYTCLLYTSDAADDLLCVD